MKKDNSNVEVEVMRVLRSLSSELQLGSAVCNLVVTTNLSLPLCSKRACLFNSLCMIFQ